MKIAVGISGASGSVYAKKLIEYLSVENDLFISITQNAKEIFLYETGIDFYSFIKKFDVKLFDENDMFAPISSGSFTLDGCVVVPCSMKTLASIANGYSDTLVSRCADVSIKQKRKLIVVPRETPLSAIHLENMLKLSRLNVSVVVPSVGFYSKPKTVNDCVDFVVGKILDELKIEHNLYTRWGENN